MIGAEGFEELYEQLESGLADLGSAMSAGWSGRAIGVVQTSIDALKGIDLASILVDREAEIAFFYRVWPRFYSKFFLCSLVACFELDRSIHPGAALSALLRREERKCTAFFRENREFWGYYKLGSAHIAHEFTRAYSRACILDPLSLVLDGEGGTVASHRAAWGLAFEAYRGYLRHVACEGPTVSGDAFEWKETKSAAVELLKAQAEKQSIYVNGRPATAAQLRADFEARYGVDLKDFDKLLYAGDTRKKEATPYLNELAAAFEGRRGRLRK